MEQEAVENEEEEYGMHFGKRDIYRVGTNMLMLTSFFDDPGTGPFDEYQPPLGSLRSSVAQGKQMAYGARTNLFDAEVKRIFQGEALPELGRPPNKTKAKRKELGVIIPPAAPKWHSTPGDAYGCFDKHPQRFDPEVRPPIEVAKEKRCLPNMMIQPGRRGGPGFLDICINPYLPMYLHCEPYDPEDLLVPSKGPKDVKPKREFVSQCKPAEYFTENPYRRLAQARPSEKSGRKNKQVAAPDRPCFYRYFPSAPLGPFNGCFSRFPLYLPNPPPREKRKKRGQRPLPPIRPVGGPPVRSKYTTSVIDLVTRIACNANNFAEYREQVYPLKRDLGGR
ncbi:UPF0602 protein C4orf47 homolog [Copidosoma floridanum]|uniref:UPF0602 protein C4orf47 homolog n=1 Tax=Copidosoma floridanum TaxID=29053 RepID=UPI0006C9C095|nr:UPF0602 protein C4orf47 homolog [Copidosoma floridanum]